jgi:hypothetical protein
MTNILFTEDDSAEFNVGDCVYELRAYSGLDFTTDSPEYVVLPLDVIPDKDPESPVFLEFLRKQLTLRGKDDYLYTIVYLGMVEAA